MHDDLDADSINTWTLGHLTHALARHNEDHQLAQLIQAGTSYLNLAPAITEILANNPALTHDLLICLLDLDDREFMTNLINHYTHTEPTPCAPAINRG